MSGKIGLMILVFAGSLILAMAGTWAGEQEQLPDSLRDPVLENLMKAVQVPDSIIIAVSLARQKKLFDENGIVIPDRYVHVQPDKRRAWFIDIDADLARRLTDAATTVFDIEKRGK